MSHPSLRTRRTRVLAAAVATPVVAALLAACGSAEPTTTTSSSGSAEDFAPVTVEHAFGETTIEEQPERVATWGWGSTDAAIALGVVPVAIPKQGYGADAEGYMPWIKEALDATEGAEAPVMLTDEGAPRSRRSSRPRPTSSSPATRASPRPTTTSSARSRRPSPTRTSPGRPPGAR